MPQFDWTVSLGSIINAAAVLSGGIVALVTMRQEIIALGARIGRLEVQSEKQIDILSRLAAQEARLDGVDTRINDLALRIDPPPSRQR